MTSPDDTLPPEYLDTAPPPAPVAPVSAIATPADLAAAHEVTLVQEGVAAEAAALGEAQARLIDRIEASPVMQAIAQGVDVLNGALAAADSVAGSLLPPAESVVLDVLAKAVAEADAMLAKFKL